jgi:hypothetical protein
MVHIWLHQPGFEPRRPHFRWSGGVGRPSLQTRVEANSVPCVQVTPGADQPLAPITIITTRVKCFDLNLLTKNA